MSPETKYVVLSIIGTAFARGAVVSLKDFTEHLQGRADPAARVAHWLARGVLREATPAEAKHARVSLPDGPASKTAEEKVTHLELQVEELKKQNASLARELEGLKAARDPLAATRGGDEGLAKLLADKDRVIEDLRRQVGAKGHKSEK